MKHQRQSNRVDVLDTRKSAQNVHISWSDQDQKMRVNVRIAAEKGDGLNRTTTLKDVGLTPEEREQFVGYVNKMIAHAKVTEKFIEVADEPDPEAEEEVEE